MAARKPDCGALEARFSAGGAGATRALSQGIRAGCAFTSGQDAPKPCVLVPRSFKQSNGALVEFKARQGDCPPPPKREATPAQAAVRAAFGEAAKACAGSPPAKLRLCVREKLLAPAPEPTSPFAGHTQGPPVNRRELAAELRAEREGGDDVPASGNPLAGLEQDIPYQAAYDAHRHTSFTPDRRAEQRQAEYAQTLRADYERLAQHANTPEKRAALDAAFLEYRGRYRRHTLEMLAASSRTASAMITGPARFPTERNRKRMDTADRRTGELIDFRKRALGELEKVVRPELRPIMTGDSDADARLKDKLANAEKLQEAMKAANVAIRKHAKEGPEAQVRALLALNIGPIDEARARQLLVPDFAGRVGFADYAITNNGAEIRRLKARLEQVERVQAMPAVESTGAGGVRLEDVPAENRVRLHFPGKPDDAMREQLKRNGFRWAPSQGAWSAYRNFHSLELAKKLAGGGA